ncbi:MAG: nucleoside-diphosphate sugar epimerase [Candidatus Omnitrophica bacterium CG_4_9_14_0_2_um_filter_42_8]|nr:MAG: nucleoside-diphosphate sugar epimerase [Candidatus Omnitrophica bacterium CG_4_9_14_0_2_um_filter_42_8]
MKVLITGGAGFIGSHLSDELLAGGDEVVVLDNLSTGRFENIAHLEGNKFFQFVEGDILNEMLVDKLVERCDVVYHLAAAVGVDLVVKKPLESLVTNIKGSEIVLDMVHRYHKKILITSTSEIYGKNTNGPLKEDDDRILGSPLKVRWGYSTAKAVDEMLAYIYWKEKKVPTIIVRLFNTVGPRQTGAYGMVIPRFVNQALKNEDLTVYGTGKQSRCFLHVKDVIKTLIKLMNSKEAVGQVFNIGSQEEITMEDLAKKIIEITKSKSKLVYISYELAYEEGFEDMQRRVPDTTKVKNLAGFKPTIDLEGTIKSVVEYYKK